MLCLRGVWVLLNKQAEVNIIQCMEGYIHHQSYNPLKLMGLLSTPLIWTCSNLGPLYGELHHVNDEEKRMGIIMLMSTVEV